MSRTRLLWAVALGLAVGLVAALLSRTVSPTAGWTFMGAVLVVAYLRWRRAMRR